MSLLSGEKLREAIVRVSGGGNVSCAVAFWGRGASNLIGPLQHRTVRLVCNLSTGGTNPDAIKELIDLGAEVRQIDRLHAKVYIGDRRAVVTSANASINGLGLEGNDLAGWIETGVEVPAEDALPWFDGIWTQGRPILDQDIIDARRNFRERAIMRPTRDSFVDFHPAENDFPLIEWEGDADYSYNDENIEAGVGYVNDAVHRQIDEGFDVESPTDLSIFPRGRWCLRWSPRADGQPRRRSRIWWTCSSGVHVPNAFTYEGEDSQGTVLAMDPMPPEPFDPNKPEFRRVFHDIMSRPQFSSLRCEEYEGSWYTDERLQAMWEFWATLRAEIVSAHSRVG